MSTIVTPDTLSDAVEFYCPFVITTDADGRHYVTDAPDGIYAPDVEHDDRHDMLVDGVPYWEHGVLTPWQALTEYAGQHGYTGPTMHASEYLGGALAYDILADAPDPGEDPAYAYVLTPVEVIACDDSCTDHTPEDVAEGTADHEPAGWAILRRRIA